MALGSWGLLNPQNFALVDRLFDNIYLVVSVATLLAGAALALLARHRWLAVVFVAPVVLVACLWATFGAGSVPLFEDDEIEATAAAPSGEYRAVVRSSIDVIDPVWIVSIQQTGSLTAREFKVGCINGDDPQYTFRRIRWTDPEHLTVRLFDHISTVTVDRESGKPSPVSGEVWNC